MALRKFRRDVSVGCVDMWKAFQPVYDEGDEDTPEVASTWNLRHGPAKLLYWPAKTITFFVFVWLFV